MAKRTREMTRREINSLQELRRPLSGAGVQRGFPGRSCCSRFDIAVKRNRPSPRDSIPACEGKCPAKLRFRSIRGVPREIIDADKPHPRSEIYVAIPPRRPTLRLSRASPQTLCYDIRQRFCSNVESVVWRVEACSASSTTATIPSIDVSIIAAA